MNTIPVSAGSGSLSAMGIRIGIMDEQALPVIIVHLMQYAWHCNGWQLCQQVHASTPGSGIRLYYPDGVIIIIKVRDGVHRFIHQVLAGKAQQVHFTNSSGMVNSSVLPRCKAHQLRLLGKGNPNSREKHTSSYPEVAALLAVYQIQHISSAVKQTAWV